jgi:hypothetical protein
MVCQRHAVARVAGRQAAVVAAGDCLAQIWPTWASDGLGRAQMGLGGPGPYTSWCLLEVAALMQVG